MLLPETKDRSLEQIERDVTGIGPGDKEAEAA